MGWGHPKDRRCHPHLPAWHPTPGPLLAVPFLHYHAGHALDALPAVILIVDVLSHILEVLHVGPHQHCPQLHEIRVGWVLHCRGARGQGSQPVPHIPPKGPGTDQRGDGARHVPIPSGTLGTQLSITFHNAPGVEAPADAPAFGFHHHVAANDSKGNALLQEDGRG